MHTIDKSSDNSFQDLLSELHGTVQEGKFWLQRQIFYHWHQTGSQQICQNDCRKQNIKIKQYENSMITTNLENFGSILKKALNPPWIVISNSFSITKCLQERIRLYHTENEISNTLIADTGQESRRGEPTKQVRK